MASNKIPKCKNDDLLKHKDNNELAFDYRAAAGSSGGTKDISGVTEEDYSTDDYNAASTQKRKPEESDADLKDSEIDYSAAAGSSSDDNGGSVNEEEYGQDEYNAFFCLAYMKHQPLDAEASEILQESRAQLLAPPIINNQPQQEAAPNYIPPIAALEGVVGECGRPIRKVLTHTDVNDGQLRLCLKKQHVKDYFLPLLDITEDVLNGIEVIVYDSEGHEYAMSFKLWSKKMYVLANHGWKRFYKEHGLQKDSEITVWMFRHTQTQRICFAITYVL